MDDHPILLNGIVDEIQTKDSYKPIFVNDFAPVDRCKRYTYIKELKKGLPIRCIMLTKSFGSNIGNYHYVWKIPPHVSFENTMVENQRIIRLNLDQPPMYHTPCMRREFMNKFGLISSSTKLYVSVRDLMEQVSKLCPADTPIPSQQFLHLQ